MYQGSKLTSDLAGIVMSPGYSHNIIQLFNYDNILTLVTHLLPRSDHRSVSDLPDSISFT